MANYMADVAKLIGVELNEIFEYETLPGIPFKLTETGLVCLGPATISRDVMNESLLRILTGCTKIKRKPWRPKYGEIYYCVGTDFKIGNNRNENCFTDIVLYKLGNCYKTRKEAEANFDKWVKFFESDEVLEV